MAYAILFAPFAIRGVEQPEEILGISTTQRGAEAQARQFIRDNFEQVPDPRELHLINLSTKEKNQYLKTGRIPRRFIYPPNWIIVNTRTQKPKKSFQTEAAAMNEWHRLGGRASIYRIFSRRLSMFI